MQGWDPLSWNLEKDLPLDKIKSVDEKKNVSLTESEISWIEAWNEFVLVMRERLKGYKLPGFPIWVDAWVHIDELKIPKGTPDLKKTFLQKRSK